MQNVQCQNMICHHQEGLLSNIRAGVLYLWSRISFNWTFWVYNSKSNTEFQDSFMSLRMIFWSFILSKTCGRAASGENVQVESIFSKWDFVQVLLLNAEEQNTFCHKTKKIKASFVLPSFTKKWTHQNVGNSSKWLLGITEYFLRWWTSYQSYHSFSGPPLSKMAGESNFPPWGRSGCQIPYPRALHRV